MQENVRHIKLNPGPMHYCQFIPKMPSKSSWNCWNYFTVEQRNRHTKVGYLFGYKNDNRR